MSPLFACMGCCSPLLSSTFITHAYTRKKENKKANDDGATTQPNVLAFASFPSSSSSASSYPPA